jgi:cytoskeleton protein RodZ
VGAVSDDSARPLGDWLRERREEQGVSLEQAEAETRIRLCYLEALETEDFDALPDPVVGRGFLRNYAAYLDLDPQAAVSRYGDLVAPPEPESVRVDESSPFNSGSFRPVPLHEMPDARSGRGLLIALLAVLVITLAVAAWWSYPRISEWIPWENLTALSAAVRPTEEATENSGGLNLSTATHTPTTAAAETSTPAGLSTSAPTDEPGQTRTESPPTLEPTLAEAFTPSPTPTPSPPIYTGIFFELVFTDTSWIQVTTDGVRQFQGELESGTYRSFYAEERLELRVGNAGAVDITLNGQKLGTLGATGEVVDQVFEKVGDAVGQATITPSPTPGPGTEIAPEPTVAPPTATITPTETISPAVMTPTAGP